MELRCVNERYGDVTSTSDERCATFRYNHREMELAVQIVRFVEEHQPPIVEAEFVDADARRHTFIEKSAIFMDDYPSVDSKYPATWRDSMRSSHTPA